MEYGHWAMCVLYKVENHITMHSIVLWVLNCKNPLLSFVRTKKQIMIINTVEKEVLMTITTSHADDEWW